MSKGTIMFNGVDYSNGGLGGNPANNYSTEEQVVGTWIDGKPVYQKSFEINIETYGTTTSTGITLNNLDKIVKLDYVKYRGDGNDITSGSDYAEATFNANFLCYVRVLHNELTYYATSRDYGLTRMIGTVQYTKITD